MAEARESNSPFSEDFEEGSTIWGTWIADQNRLYHAIECNRSMSSSEGPFQVRYYHICVVGDFTQHLRLLF